ncbi:MAG: aldo/keto reductase, partial [Bdellovibrionota bacterium]
MDPIGFGGYRIALEDPEQEAALRDALLGGIRLLDTSANYGDGESEQLMGKVLHELFDSGEITREEVTVVSKVGYVQGKNFELAVQRIREGRPFPEMVEYTSGLWHCISPDFLEDQLTRSLERLKLDYLDFYLLHNPEYFLKQSSDHPEYYRRIENAFHHLEKEVASGRIRAYGISSNTFPDPKDSQAYTSLEAVHGIAEAIRPDHHFKVIQFPLNLIEAGAALERNNSGKTVLQYAREHGILTLANRPLNAFTGEQLLRLADFPERNQAEVLGRLKDTLTQAMGIERHYPGEEIVPSAKIAWGHILKQNFERLSELDQWRQILANQARPTLRRAFAELEPRYAKWCADYRVASENLFQAFTHFLEWQAGAESRRILDALLRGAP